MLAAIATVFTPAFLVTGTTVMSDMLSIALWVWAVYFWVRGLDDESTASLVAAGLLITASTLTKYPGMNLIPLLGAYALVCRKSIKFWAPWLVLPIVLLLVYQLVTGQMYGHGLLFAAATYSGQIRAKVSTGFVLKGAVGLSFAGGSMITALFFSPLVWRKKCLAVLGALFVIFIMILLAVGSFTKFRLTTDVGAVRWSLIVQAAAFMLAGVSILAMAISDAARRRDPASVLLLLWVAGTFVFSAFVNWSINARTMMPMAPAVSILIARHLEARWADKGGVRIWAPLVPALVVSLMVTCADYSLAGAARHAARSLHAKYSELGRTAGRGLWFQGHWGFQYYVQLSGGRIIDWKSSRIRRGDIVVIPINNYDIDILPMNELGFVEKLDLPLFSGAATMYEPYGAGFYSSLGGPLPYAFGTGFEDSYLVMYAKDDLELKLKRD